MRISWDYILPLEWCVCIQQVVADKRNEGMQLWGLLSTFIYWIQPVILRVLFSIHTLGINNRNKTSMFSPWLHATYAHLAIIVQSVLECLWLILLAGIQRSYSYTNIRYETNWSYISCDFMHMTQWQWAWLFVYCLVCTEFLSFVLNTFLCPWTMEKQATNIFIAISNSDGGVKSADCLLIIRKVQSSSVLPSFIPENPIGLSTSIQTVETGFQHLRFES